MEKIPAPTNRSEWKQQYQAARLLLQAGIPAFDARPVFRKQSSLAMSAGCEAVKGLFHASIAMAAFSYDEPVFPVSEYSWAARSNSRAFNRKSCKRKVSRYRQLPIDRL